MRYYEKRAAKHCPTCRERRRAIRQSNSRTGHRGPTNAPPGAAHVSLVKLFHKDKLDILVCDALNNQVLAVSPYESSPAWKALARGVCCGHAEVADLDGDGVNDIILSVLGTFHATDNRVGQQRPSDW